MSDIRHVYIMPMSGGLDQYLAHQLVASGHFAVVTEPERADAVLTDQIGATFEERYQTLYPPPPPPHAEVTHSAEATHGTDEKAPSHEGEKSLVAQFGEVALGQPKSTFSRGKGNIFIVDRHSRLVVWSTFLKPKNTRPDEMDRTAAKIVDRMQDTLSHEDKMAKKAAKEGHEVMVIASPPAEAAAPAHTPEPSPATPPSAPAATPPPAPAGTPAHATPAANTPQPASPATPATATPTAVPPPAGAPAPAATTPPPAAPKPTAPSTAPQTAPPTTVTPAPAATAPPPAAPKPTAPATAPQTTPPAAPVPAPAKP